MAMFSNFTRFAVGEIIGIDPEAVEFYALIVKATYSWDEKGELLPADPQPLVEVDVYAGEPGLSGPLYEADYCPFKPRVDVLLHGALALPTPVGQIDATLEVGNRIRKTVRVFGDRAWIPGVVKTLALSKPRPFARMPLEWERAFGGTDPDDPKCFEPKNPFGRGMRRKAPALEGQPAPNFEDPRHLIESWDDHPAPVGFGPVGKSWQPRIRLAGTYDDAWMEERYPLAPADFDPAFHNCAPADQQLDGYLPGEEVRLHYMTPAGHDRFRLPALEVPVAFRDKRGREIYERLRPDTIVIEPAQRRVSLVGRVCHFPEPNVLSLASVLVGQPWPGVVRAMKSGKQYLQPRSLLPGMPT